jgi:hypothetical protein
MEGTIIDGRRKAGLPKERRRSAVASSIDCSHTASP